MQQTNQDALIKIRDTIQSANLSQDFFSAATQILDLIKYGNFDAPINSNLNSLADQIVGVIKDGFYNEDYRRNWLLTMATIISWVSKR